MYACVYREWVEARVVPEGGQGKGKAARDRSDKGFTRHVVYGTPARSARTASAWSWVYCIDIPISSIYIAVSPLAARVDCPPQTVPLLRVCPAGPVASALNSPRTAAATATLHKRALLSLVRAHHVRFAPRHSREGGQGKGASSASSRVSCSVVQKGLHGLGGRALEARCCCKRQTI